MDPLKLHGMYVREKDAHQYSCLTKENKEVDRFGDVVFKSGVRCLSEPMYLVDWLDAKGKRVFNKPAEYSVMAAKKCISRGDWIAIQCPFELGTGKLILPLVDIAEEADRELP